MFNFSTKILSLALLFSVTQATEIETATEIEVATETESRPYGYESRSYRPSGYGRSLGY